jgi:flagellar hook-length control protein FliK
MGSPGNGQFSKVLEHTQDDTPRPRSTPPRSAASQDTQARAMTRRPEVAAERDAQRSEEGGTAYRPESANGDQRADAPRKPVRAAAGDDDRASSDKDKSDKSGPQAVQPDPTAVRMPTQVVAPTAAQLAGAVPQPGNALTAVATPPTLASGYAPSGEIGGTLQSQIGAAAYRLSPHGVGEPSLPVTPATPQPSTALQHADPNQVLRTEPHVVSAVEMVQLSNAARAATLSGEDGMGKPVGAAHAETGKAMHADPNSALGRNQLLQQIGGPAGAAPQVNPAAAAPVQAQINSSGLAGKSTSELKDTKSDSVAPVGASTDSTATATAVAVPAAAVGTAHAVHDAQPAPDAATKADPALMNRIAEQSRWLIRSGHSEVTFKLQPEHLGDMKLKVVHKDGELSIQMTVDSAATKHLVEANFNDLRQRLQQESLTQGNLLLNVDVQQGSDQNQFARLAQQAATDGRAQPVNGLQADQTAPVEASRPAAWGNSKVSIYA